MASSVVKGTVGARAQQWTEAAIIIAVSGAGSDAATFARPNKLLGGDYSATPFATPQAALDALPKGLNHDITVRVAAGTFAGFVATGFVGTGKLKVCGSSALSTLTTGVNAGTAGAGTSTTSMNKPAAVANWTASDLRGKFLRINSGGGASGDSDFPTIRPIKSNTTTALVVDAIVGMDATSVFQIVDVASIFTAAAAQVEGLAVRAAFSQCSAAVRTTLLKATETVGTAYGYLAWNCLDIAASGCDLRASSGFAGAATNCDKALFDSSLLDGPYNPSGCRWASATDVVIQSSGYVDMQYAVHGAVIADALSCAATAVKVRDCVYVSCGLVANSCTATPLDVQNIHNFAIDGALTGTNAGTLRFAKFSKGGQFIVSGADGAGNDYYEFEIEGRPGKWSELSGGNSGTYMSRGTFLHWGTGYTVCQTKYRVAGGVSGDDFDEFITNNMVIGGIVKHYGAWQSLDPAYKQITAHAGGGQGSATVVGLRDTIVTTVATAGDSARLLSGSDVSYAGGLMGTVANQAALAFNLFPPSGAKIYLAGVDQGTNVAISVPPGCQVVWLSRNDLNYSVFLNRGVITPASVTGNQSPTANNIGVNFNNIGASGAVTVTGPAVPGVGYEVRMRVAVAQNFIFQLPTGHTAYLGDSQTTTVSGTITGATVGSTINLEYAGASTWFATAMTGAWTAA